MRRRWLLLLLLGVVGASVYGGVALATPPSGLTNVPLARGTNVSKGTIPLQFGTDVAMAQITVVPGGSSGWHSHPGGAIIVVKAGPLTVYPAVGSQCETTTYSAGQAFIERPGEVDQVVNTGTIPYSCSSPSRVCLRATPREPTSLTRARARVCKAERANEAARFERVADIGRNAFSGGAMRTLFAVVATVLCAASQVGCSVRPRIDER